MQQEHKELLQMAKVPVKKPAIKAPKMTLQPGEKKPLDVKAVKLKIAKIEAMKAELSKLESANILTKYFNKPEAFANKQLVAKMAEFHEILNAEEVKLQDELQKATTAAMATQAKSFGPLIQTIQKECSQVLTAYKATGKVLFRGLKKGKTNTPAYVGRSWNERKTMNSDPEGQKLFDYALQKMGISALRSNSIFTTTDSKQAGQYGNLYIIIPKNGFQFSWALHEDDMVIDTEDVMLLYKNNIVDKIMDNVDALVEKGKMSNDASGYEWQEVLQFEGYEAAIKYLKDAKYPPAALKKLTLDAMIDFQHIKNDITPDNKNFNAAINSGHEVLINGEYYAFELSKFKDTLSGLLGIKIIN
jgi:hypothetical protein